MEVYRNDPDRVKTNTEATRNGLLRLSQPEPGGNISLETVDAAAARLVQEVGTEHKELAVGPNFRNPHSSSSSGVPGNRFDFLNIAKPSTLD